MKRFKILIIIIFLIFPLKVFTDDVSGNDGETLTLTKDIKLNVISNYQMSIISIQVLGDGNIHGEEDLGGVWDFGTLDPSKILEDNPYGTGLRIGSSHYMDVRFYISNNANPYHVDIVYSGTISNLPATEGSPEDDSPLHFATFDIHTFVEEQETQHPENLNYVSESEGSNEETGLFPLRADVTYTLYNTDVISNDAFAMLVFIDNVSPDYNVSLVDPEGNGIVGSVTYSMVPNL